VRGNARGAGGSMWQCARVCACSARGSVVILIVYGSVQALCGCLAVRQYAVMCGSVR
jgi:hypothetical protein